MPLPKIRPWKRGDPFSAAHLNEVSDAMRALWPITGSGGVDVITGLQGTSISYRQQNRAGGLVWVDLTQTGGLAGDATTECSFTYTIKARGSSTNLSVNVALAGHRVLKCAMIAGTTGIAAQDTDGSWKIISCDERQTQNICIVT